MTIDAFDWLHRTGANPPHPTRAGNNCTSAPARPFLYEGVLRPRVPAPAHELRRPGREVNWINEGLSDWAQTLVGYVDPSVTADHADGRLAHAVLPRLPVHTANPNPGDGGPENSLTRWGDQGTGEILCDYGAAYTFMEYLHGHSARPS